jgi:hypothetical protein
MMDVTYDNTTATGWQHGFPDALARLDLDTARHVPWDDGVPFFLKLPTWNKKHDQEFLFYLFTLYLQYFHVLNSIFRS